MSDYIHGRRLTLDRATHMSMCGLVLSQWDALTWRHSGLGVLQAYLLEGETDELRVHVWDPEMKRDGIEESGLDHDHRFDMTSHVLYGQLTQTEITLVPELRSGSHVLWEVVHARAADKHAPNDGKMQVCAAPDGTIFRYDVARRRSLVSEGTAYTFPKRVFHRTSAHGVAITLVQKSNQTDTPARILAPFGKPVVHAFAEPLPKEAWQPTLAVARRRLTQGFTGRI